MTALRIQMLGRFKLIYCKVGMRTCRGHTVEEVLYQCYTVLFTHAASPCSLTDPAQHYDVYILYV